ncbi:bifunctional precorrin-2 dehydrogenase/sirohydrochlorin ferrochelatase [Bifidobacterium sp. MA2]|uniref:precorrin-2 dehydrogenase n=1 Tax=Bifidobacterium santillanense TaxID=2809028 RepID=A0ABS5UQ57_9BIFI|nr:bifunctional precorrin-2 dehydrogenase/sirohydrochlorin ferrochelatase [Bifidobacterium santillanense]MBT1173076.1 bifunctional precorrin-2 dehydrogenase/sirohydrochlorin ferrochelatase [Bifidobacterium santillanense]
MSDMNVNGSDETLESEAFEAEPEADAFAPSPYPVDLRVKGERAVVVGGGRVATRKVTHLLAAGAKVTVVAPELDERLAAEADDGAIDWRCKPYATGDLDGARIVIACTDDQDVNHRVVADAEPGQLVNNTGDPSESDFFNVAVVEHGNLIFTVSSKGIDPALVRRVKQRLADALPDLLADAQ